MILLAVVALDVSIVLALALGATWLLRRRSAATRHWILATALACAAAIPAFELITPAWNITLPAWLSPGATSTLTLTNSLAPEGSAVLAAAPAAVAAPSVFDRPESLIVGGWLSGVAAALIMLLTGLARLGRLRRRAHVISDGRAAAAAADAAGAYGLRRPVLLLQSDHPALVVTWGFLRPRVLLPSGSEHWTDDRLRVVLAHELAHVRRGDWSLQILASLLQSVYWFNPLVWLACRQLRLESERACDDAVLSSGIAGSDYAAHLLAVARDAVRLRHVWTPANAIAHPSTLEQRIRAMLNGGLNRNPLSRFTRYATVMAFGAFAAVVAGAAVSARTPIAAQDVVLPGSAGQPRIEVTTAITPERTVVVEARVIAAAPAAPAEPAAPLDAARGGQQAPATLSGVIRDASGAVLPGVRLTMTDAKFGPRYTAVSDGAGRFAFSDLPPSRYELVAVLPGFATVTEALDLAAGATVERSLALRIGGLQETITVTCAAGAASLGRMLRGVMAFMVTPVYAQAPLGTPIRVGGQIRAPQQIRNVNPICPGPPAADTVVILEATIGTDGLVRDVRNLRNSVPTELAEAAMEAVRQWQYTPTLLNNVAVPVIMTVTVNFRRS